MVWFLLDLTRLRTQEVGLILKKWDKAFNREVSVKQQVSGRGVDWPSVRGRDSQGAAGVNKNQGIHVVEEIVVGITVRIMVRRIANSQNISIGLELQSYCN